MVDKPDLLRQFALMVISEDHHLADDAILAVCGFSDEGWKPHTAYSDVIEGTWFVWRDPDDITNNVHVDRAMVRDGKIFSKYGCGIKWYSECQPCSFAQDLVDAIAKGEEFRRKHDDRTHK